MRELQDPVSVYRQCMDLMTRLAAQGLVHCDFNEFNLLVGGLSTAAWFGWEGLAAS